VAPLRRSLYGKCVFSTKTDGDTALSDELIAASETPLFAQNVLALQAAFNATILPYETAYWNATSIGARPPGSLPRQQASRQGLSVNLRTCTSTHSAGFIPACFLCIYWLGGQTSTTLIHMTSP
jgi:hypothetical protein